MKLFYWTDYSYEVIYLAYAPDRETARQLIQEEVRKGVDSDNARKLGLTVHHVAIEYVEEFTDTGVAKLTSFRLSDGDMQS